MRPTAEPRHGTVADWMTKTPATVPEDCSIAVALGRMRVGEVRHLLVMDGDRLSGIVSTRDVRRLVLDDPGAESLSGPVRSIMTEDPVTVAPETGVTTAARVLLEQRIGALPVRNGDQIVGIFTIADALEALLVMVERPVA
jgi:acetoin utilization protein AcuB